MAAARVNLLSPLTLKGVTFRNRIGISPMCMYVAEDGFANDFHLVHLGSRASGGSGLVIVEASAVHKDGRITPGDLGIWKDEHVTMLKNITSFLKKQGSVPGIQIGHAGRKASTYIPNHPSRGASLTTEDGAWDTVSASPIAFGKNISHVPREMTKDDIKELVQQFADSARRANEAGFELLEIHGAHGYLLHQFYSPLSNKRTDDYGGSYENRTRIVREIVTAVRKVWPQDKPLGIRLSVTDWVEGGWTIDDSVVLSAELKTIGIDFVDCSSGYNTTDYDKIPNGPGYQVPFAERIKKETGLLTFAVGDISEATHADDIIRNQRADFILIARASLRDPYWAYHAAQTLRNEKPQSLVAPEYLWAVRF